MERKIALQNGIDAALLSGSEVLATGLNKMSHLNQKLIRYQKLLSLVKAGTILHSSTGLLLTKVILEKRIKSIAAQQDFIKKIFPLYATKETYVTARKHKTPHIILSPPSLPYAIHRTPSQNKLPGPYELDARFGKKQSWSIRGYFYKGAYQASAKISLFGTDLTSTDWKGMFIE